MTSTRRLMSPHLVSQPNQPPALRAPIPTGLLDIPTVHQLEIKNYPEAALSFTRPQSSSHQALPPDNALATYLDSLCLGLCLPPFPSSIHLSNQSNSPPCLTPFHGAPELKVKVLGLTPKALQTTRHAFLPSHSSSISYHTSCVLQQNS